MEESGWITLTEAARRLGVSRTAVRQRVQRGTLPTMMDNHGRPLTRLQDGSGTVRNGTFHNVPDGTVPPKTEPFQNVPQGAVSASEAVPVSVVRDLLAQQQAAHVAVLAAIEQRHQAEIARLESRHTAEIGRFAQAQAAAIKVLMDRVGAVLLANRRRPWWRWS